MRLSVLILAATVSTAFAQAPGNRGASYDRLRDEAHAAKLINQLSADIQASRYEAALKKADEAELLLPDDPLVLNSRGAVLTELRRYDEAAKVLEQAVAANPAAFAPRYNQGELLALQKNYSGAALHFLALQSRFGAMPLLKYKLYLCYALDGRQDKASETLALMRYPQDGTAWYFAYAADCLFAGKKAEAQRLIAVAAAIDEKDTQTYRDTLRNAGLLK